MKSPRSLIIKVPCESTTASTSCVYFDDKNILTDRSATETNHFGYGNVTKQPRERKYMYDDVGAR